MRLTIPIHHEMEPRNSGNLEVNPAGFQHTLWPNIALHRLVERPETLQRNGKTCALMALYVR